MLPKRKLTYNDIMSLKKVDVDNCNIDKVVSRSRGGPVNSGPFMELESKWKLKAGFNDPREMFREDTSCKEMVKAAKASLAMESLGYEYDEGRQQWFRREYL